MMHNKKPEILPIGRHIFLVMITTVAVTIIIALFTFMFEERNAKILDTSLSRSINKLSDTLENRSSAVSLETSSTHPANSKLLLNTDFSSDLKGAYVSVNGELGEGEFCILMYHPDASTYNENNPLIYDSLYGRVSSGDKCSSDGMNKLASDAIKIDAEGRVDLTGLSFSESKPTSAP